jgi:hypothetical protein
MDGFSTSRRILYRALAVVVALAAISPLLFEADLSGSVDGDNQKAQAQIASLPPLLQTGGATALGVEAPAPAHFRHH